MAKARLSQMASTWVHEEGENKSKHKEIKTSKIKKVKMSNNLTKKVQTVRLRPEALKRLWMNRALTGKNLSETIDELVMKHIHV